jgi:protein MpaA
VPAAPAPDPPDTPLLAAVRRLALEELGRSALGRPIGGRRFGGAGPALLIFGGIHGDEPASVEVLLDLALRLEAAPAAPAAPIWLLPVVNPDGVARGFKNSARDVDLNRNFPARSFSLDHQPGYSPGPAPLSEPETRALAALVDRADVQAAVAVHAPFGCINYDGPAAAWAEAVAAASGWPARAHIGYPTPGSLGSWLGIDRSLPVLTLELPPGQAAGFAAPAAAALDAAIAFHARRAANTEFGGILP